MIGDPDPFGDMCSADDARPNSNDGRPERWRPLERGEVTWGSFMGGFPNSNARNHGAHGLDHRVTTFPTMHSPSIGRSTLQTRTTLPPASE